jgi:hypothetical protein
MKTAHQGAYVTIADKFSNRIPVVMIDGRWVTWTPQTLRESRQKAPPMNFGLAAARMPKNNNSKVPPRDEIPATTRHNEEPAVPLISPPMDTSAVADTGPSIPAGFVRTQATAINARTDEERSITLAPATMFGTADFPPLEATVVTSSEQTTRPNSSGNENTILTNGEQGNEEDKDDEMEEDLDTSYALNDVGINCRPKCCYLSQVAQRQAFDVSKEANAILHHSDCEEEDMKNHTTSAFAKLESKRKKAKKQSSLAVALIHAELEKRNAELARGASICRTPIWPPERDS